MKIELVAVGTKPPAWVLDGIQQYTSRLTRECRFSITEIRTSDRKKPKSVNSLKNEEGKALLAAVSDSARVIVLDRSGKDWSTEQFAGKLQDWSQLTNHFQFLVGGPDGLATECLERADEVWSLSKLTYPHFLVRVMLAEQIYRALMVNAGHPYHK
ncbi:MAG: 23S rRNA (pseudouridine(1915)-N(3))-methyltransferase RlmH [Gammaproteobacteria bacterium]|nr:23S rRNA (pseudouridine(1915)-N(3))-methyltransferase RlmH [Gammaproteobacteria bacterium]MBT7370441.1 23S rRNA (pseudouridine(1915)-N(3))-methyltransferase RlmH [Gammaproteobacteria bacterium]